MKKYIAVFNTALQNAITWRGQLWFNTILNALPFIAYYYLWTTVFANRGTTAGFSYDTLLTYSVVALIFNRVTSVSPEYGIMENIREGSLTKYLVQPISYFGYYWASRTASRTFVFLVSLPMLAVILYVLRHHLQVPAHGWQWALFLASVPVAYGLQFVFGLFLGFLTFWILEARYFQLVKGLVVRFFSGVLLPFAFFPHSVQTVLGLLPFKFLASFPVNIYLGKTNATDALIGIATGIVWIVALHWLARRMWLNGLKRYVAVGH